MEKDLKFYTQNLHLPLLLLYFDQLHFGLLPLQSLHFDPFVSLSIRFIRLRLQHLCNLLIRLQGFLLEKKTEVPTTVVQIRVPFAHLLRHLETYLRF